MGSHVEHLVVGPPGTGKTTYLARQTKLAAQKYGTDGVMVASLTKTAAQEVGGRDTGINPDRISTLHGHAFRALDRPKIAEGADGVKEWNEWAAKQPWFAGGRMRMEPKGSNGDPEWKPAEARMAGIGTGSAEALLQEVGIWRARRTHPDLWPSKVRQFSQHWEEFKRETGMLDFTDLIEVCLTTVRYPPGTPKIMMVDEAQDMSALEFALIRKWAGTCEQTVTVGDPDQCLYAWRGTDPRAMTDMDFSSETTLSRSYRVPRKVHAYALAWINRVVDRREVAYNPRLNDPKDPDSGEAEGDVRKLNDSWRSPEAVIDHVEADLSGGRTVMVLASCGYMLAPAIDRLRHLGIPFMNPYRPQQGAWNPMRGARRLTTFLSPSEQVFGEHARPWTWSDVEVWMGPMNASGLLNRGAKKRIEELATRHSDVEPTLTELEELFSHSSDLWQALSLDVPWWRDHLLKDARRIARYPVAVYEKRGPAALAEQPRVIVGTIHSVKGGQADSVYVWPSLSQAGWRDGWERPDTRASTYRLFYVAFTRAREKLTLCGYKCDTSFDIDYPFVDDKGEVIAE